VKDVISVIEDAAFCIVGDLKQMKLKICPHRFLSIFLIPLD